VGFLKSSSIFEIFEARGIRISDLVEAALEVFVPHPSVDGSLDSKEAVREALEEELKIAVSDFNVCSLLLAGLKLDEDGSKGFIPNLSVEDYESDTVALVADEILGMALANYLGGTRAIFQFNQFERLKPGIIGKLPPFIDDIVSGLLAGCLTNLYNKKILR
jgi:alpha-ribazole phosphatase CobZ